jgi:hypothetical protein
MAIENVLTNGDDYLIRVIHPVLIEPGNFDPGRSDFISIDSLSISR